MKPSEDSLPPVPDLPLVSPFLCSDNSEADNDFEPAEQRPVSSSHDTLTPLSEFPLAPIVAPPKISPTLADLLPPRKRFRDSYSLEIVKGHIEVDNCKCRGCCGFRYSVGVVAYPEDSKASAADMREIAVDPLAIVKFSESSRRGIPDLEDTIYYEMSQYLKETKRAVTLLVVPAMKKMKMLNHYGDGLSIGGDFLRCGCGESLIQVVDVFWKGVLRFILDEPTFIGFLEKFGDDLSNDILGRRRRNMKEDGDR
ncbi:hypothetical protein Tco_0513732 [Tanacetum coccineum]